MEENNAEGVYMCAHPRGPFTCEIHVISIRKTHSRPLRSFGQNSDHETLKVGANLILYSSKIWEGDIWQLLLDFDCRVPRGEICGISLSISMNQGDQNTCGDRFIFMAG